MNSRGIGRAIATGLAKEGVRVAFCHHDDPKADETLAAINGLSAGMAVSADVSDEGAVAGFFKRSR
ncbi:MAG: hypothetical protein COC12_03100 [Rhodobacteraceae bacterium]|nr:MAG: hypothetical protein COC12_03100 [Paracoccaceae bacterium]